MNIVRFKLQNLIFRHDVLPDEHFAMMYRGGKLQYDPLRSAFLLESGKYTEFFTYFNAVSYGKWKKYTKVSKISLCIRAKGDFDIQLFGHYCEGESIGKEFYPLQSFRLKNYKDIEIEIPSDARASVVGFQIHAIKNCAVQSGYWYTNIDESDIRDVRIAIVSTTFKKERYIQKNVDTMEKELFYGSEECRDHFRFLIVDNGRTLNPEEFNSEYVTVYPNVNTGGAGGFTRGMIEATHSAWNPTHILLLDDDVTMLPESFVRTYGLLSLVKEEYEDYFIGGAMLRHQQMNEQYEDVGHVFDKGYFGPVKQTMYLHVWDQVLLNEEERPMPRNTYASWWYCCFPVSQLGENDLPLPVFIRCDDVDFSIRHKAKVITMNGIFVWHDEFKQKFSAAMEFYMVVRNSLITQAIDGIYQDVDFIGHIMDLFDERVSVFSYDDCELLLDALEDYLKGPEFLSTPRGEEIVKEKSQKNEKLVDLYEAAKGEKIPPFDEIKQELYESVSMDERKEKRYERTHNFQTYPDRFIKEKMEIIPYDFFMCPAKNYKATKLLAVNVDKRTAHLRERSHKRFRELMKRRKELLRDYKKRNAEITEQYRKAGATLRSEKFWRGYLGLEENKNEAL